MTFLHAFALSLLAFVLWRTARHYHLRLKWRLSRPPDRTGTDIGALPRINRRKKWTSRTP